MKIVLEATRRASARPATSEPVETFLARARVPQSGRARHRRAAQATDAASRGSRGTVAESLSDLSLRPARFDDDIVVFLALRTAQARLQLNHDAGRNPDGAEAAVADGAAHRGRPRAADPGKPAPGDAGVAGRAGAQRARCRDRAADPGAARGDEPLPPGAGAADAATGRSQHIAAGRSVAAR